MMSGICISNSFLPIFIADIYFLWTSQICVCYKSIMYLTQSVWVICMCLSVYVRNRDPHREHLSNMPSHHDNATHQGISISQPCCEEKYVESDQLSKVKYEGQWQRLKLNSQILELFNFGLSHTTEWIKTYILKSNDKDWLRQVAQQSWFVLSPLIGLVYLVPRGSR